MPQSVSIRHHAFLQVSLPAASHSALMRDHGTISLSSISVISTTIRDRRTSSPLSTVSVMALLCSTTFSSVTVLHLLEQSITKSKRVCKASRLTSSRASLYYNVVQFTSLFFKPRCSVHVVIRVWPLVVKHMHYRRGPRESDEALQCWM